MSITVADIAMHRELVGYAYCELKNETPALTDENFGSHMNIVKCCDDPEEWEFNMWTCTTAKPTQADLINTVSKVKLDEIVARFTSAQP